MTSKRQICTAIANHHWKKGWELFLQVQLLKEEWSFAKVFERNVKKSGFVILMKMTGWTLWKRPAKVFQKEEFVQPAFIYLQIIQRHLLQLQMQSLQHPLEWQSRHIFFNREHWTSKNLLKIRKWFVWKRQ